MQLCKKNARPLLAPNNTMNNTVIYKFPLLLSTIVLWLFTACAGGTAAEDKKLEKDEDFEKTVVVNEFMPSNQVGIADENGELQDWIELKNLTDETISLEGYRLMCDKEPVVNNDTTVTKPADRKRDKAPKTAPKGKIGKEEDKGDKDTLECGEWRFPDVDLQPGACLLVYASKDAGAKADTEQESAGSGWNEVGITALHAHLKLSRRAGRIRLVSADNTLLSEVSYKNMNPNQAWRRLDDGSHELSYFQSPGFDNNEAGYEAYNILIERQRTAPLRIWEYVSKTENGVAAWVEVKNVSSANVDLGDYALTRKLKKSGMWNFPAHTLKPGEICSVQLGRTKTAASKTEKAEKTSGKTFTAEAKLNDDETLLLTRGGKFIDGLCAVPTRFGMSMGRTAGGQGFYIFTETSQGAENNSKAYRYIADRPTLSEAPGPHDGVKSLKLALDTHGYTVRYTLDGTEPTRNSKVYKEPILLTKTTIVRAFAEGDKTALRSSTVTATYFINEGHKLPILSVVVPKADLYDYHNGIMVKGPGGAQPEEDHKANYWTKNTERKAHVAFYDGKEGFETYCDLKVYGGSSREQDKRSFILKFNAKYGRSNVNYDVFNRGKAEKYTALVLRGGSQDYIGIMARDEFFTSLMASQSPTLLVQDYRPVVLYLNDEYYGIYYIREKINKNYVKRHLGVSGDSIDILSSRFINDGTDKEFTALRKYAENNDLRLSKHYDHVNSRIDAQGFIDHFLGEFYASNTDLCNVRYVHSCNAAGDTRWHIVYYDLDESWHTFKGSEFYFSGQSRLFIHDGIMRAMLKNPKFRQLFLERTSWHMHHTFSKAYVAKFFNDMMDAIRPEMKRNCERWPDLSYKNWEAHQVTFVKNFETRPKAMLNDLRKQLRITPEEEKKYFADLGF